MRQTLSCIPSRGSCLRAPPSTASTCVPRLSALKRPASLCMVLLSQARASRQSSPADTLHLSSTAQTRSWAARRCGEGTHSSGSVSRMIGFLSSPATPQTFCLAPAASRNRAARARGAHAANACMDGIPLLPIARAGASERCLARRRHLGAPGSVCSDEVVCEQLRLPDAGLPGELHCLAVWQCLVASILTR